VQINGIVKNVLPDFVDECSGTLAGTLADRNGGGGRRKVKKTLDTRSSDIVNYNTINQSELIARKQSERRA
jgi:hypothetical protein